MNVVVVVILVVSPILVGYFLALRFGWNENLGKTRRYARLRDWLTVKDLATALNIPVKEAQRAVNTLVSLEALQIVPEQPGRYLVIHAKLFPQKK